MSQISKLKEIMSCKEDLETFEEKYIESVFRFYRRYGYLTRSQWDWIDIYYNKLYQLYSYE
ncbi:MAG TPA: hypothetical protein PKU78_03410 [Candidatus Dojkabacteria bacterium]|jgi:hypothetical protein|nr:hypothetical protein [Candidatus Dojkabacteria bacterium]HRO65243.1 hypothetical protein [Candidatus Dojkabacteria bacterium]HRP50791.1 hypothetical protein [Candidatus Dojkabacteria bacterium]